VQIAALGDSLGEAAKALREAAQAIVMNATRDMRAAYACSVPFLRFFGIVAGGWQLVRAAKAAWDKRAAGDADPFYSAKISTAAFYVHHVLSQSEWLRREIVEGSNDLTSVADEHFDLDRKVAVSA
jgi:acyl-CoA dehydrogenase